MKTTLIATLGALASLTAAVNANPGIVYNDATGDIEPGISTGGGTLDLVSMEVSNTSTDIQFKLTVNGNIGTTDWGKFMVGIANNKGNGTNPGALTVADYEAAGITGVSSDNLAAVNAVDDHFDGRGSWHTYVLAVASP